MGGAVVSSVTFAGGLFGGGYFVRLGVRQGRVHHVENGHTYEHNQWTFGNCTRNGNITFYPVGTNVTARLTGHTNDPNAQALADNAAWHGLSQGPVNNDQIGVDPFGAVVANTYPTFITQCYALAGAGTQIRDTSLVAIGRLMGHIP